ncbi:MAG: LPXTG cell wall anchor domain-containing protein [Micromonosporaceae bacterium]
MRVFPSARQYALAVLFGAALAAMTAVPALANPVSTPSPGEVSPEPSSSAPTGNPTTPTGEPSATTDPTPRDGLDVAAIGDAVEGAVGDEVTVTVGVENVGPRTVPGYEDTPTLGIYVDPPEGTTITQAPEQPTEAPAICARPHDKGRVWHCDFFGPIERGERKTVTFTIRINKKRAGAEGSVKIPEHSLNDVNPSNDTAPITSKISAGTGGGGELANTGAPAGLLAAAGSGAVLLGTAVVIWARRRSRAA